MWKTNNSINYSRWRKRRLALFCCKKPYTLLRGITSKHHGDFYYLNCIHSFRTENKLKSHEKLCIKYKALKNFVMPSEKDKILEFNQYMKTDKIPYIINADIESLMKKIDRCANNPENSSTTKIGEHIPCGYSVLTIWAFHHIKNKHTLCRGNDCMKMLCEYLRKHRKNVIDFEKKNVSVNKRRIKITSRCKSMLYLWKKNLIICNLKLNVPNEISVYFRSDSNGDYHFIIKELANEFHGQFECLGEITEKYKTFFCCNRKRS